MTSDINDVLTARESSIGNSGGTTDVRIKVHSKNNLYLFLLGSSVPITTCTSTWNNIPFNWLPYLANGSLRIYYTCMYMYTCIQGMTDIHVFNTIYVY